MKAESRIEYGQASTVGENIAVHKAGAAHANRRIGDFRKAEVMQTMPSSGANGG